MVWHSLLKQQTETCNPTTTPWTPRTCFRIFSYDIAQELASTSCPNGWRSQLQVWKVDPAWESDPALGVAPASFVKSMELVFTLVVESTTCSASVCIRIRSSCHSRAQSGLLMHHADGLLWLVQICIRAAVRYSLRQIEQAKPLRLNAASKQQLVLRQLQLFILFLFVPFLLSFCESVLCIH